MDEQDYLESCRSTFKPGADVKLTTEQLNCLEQTCREMLPLMQKFDRIKRSIFYGEKLREYVDPCGRVSAFLFEETFSDSANKEILHCLLGSFTEAVEKTELLHRWLVTGEGIDRTNALEETGDGWFYDTILVDLLGSTPEEVRQLISDKLLGKRYKNGYSDKAAVNRDVEAEREEMDSQLNKNQEQ